MAATGPPNQQQAFDCVAGMDFHSPSNVVIYYPPVSDESLAVMSDTNRCYRFSTHAPRESLQSPPSSQRCVPGVGGPSKVAVTNDRLEPVGGSMPESTDSSARPTDSSVPVTATAEPTETEQASRVTTLPGDAEFALCLTHDVDRPYKGIRSLYYATQERPGYHLRSALDDTNPYWQFEEIMELEADLGVRSAFYFLNEQHLLADRPPREWLSPSNWVQHLGRYDVTAPEIVDVIQALDDGGWEVGLHGSYHTATDRERLHEEKTTLESVLDGPVRGGRQHHLRLETPETWGHHRAIGLEYDASLGSSTECGFHEAITRFGRSATSSLSSR